MFCRNCGSRIEEGWTCCPNCGEDVQVGKGLTGNDEYERNEKLNNGRKAAMNTGSTVPDMCNTVSDTGSTVSGIDNTVSDVECTTPDADKRNSISLSRNILRILAIIAIVCFFCPLFMVSCAGEELLTISGEDLTLGFQCMDEDIEGNLIYGTLALFPFLGLSVAAAGHKKPDGHIDYEKVKESFYENAAAAGATVIMIRYFKNALIDAFKETAIDITPCKALHIMSGVCVISVFLGGYQAYKMELHGSGKASGKVVTALKCGGRILAGSVGLVLVALVISHYLGGLGLDEISGEMTTDYSAMAGIRNKLGLY